MVSAASPPAIPPVPMHIGGGSSNEVSQSIRLLEEQKWRIILEHGAMGEVVAVAAFAPGPGGEAPSTPNTPATPSGAAGSGVFADGFVEIDDLVPAFDLFLELSNVVGLARQEHLCYK